MTISFNSTMANKPAFGGCAIKGSGADKFFKGKIAAEGAQAVAEFRNFCDELTSWGYVNINKTAKDDVYQLQGKSGLYTTNINETETLNDLKAKLQFLKDSDAIIDQA